MVVNILQAMQWHLTKQFDEIVNKKSLTQSHSNVGQAFHSDWEF